MHLRISFSALHLAYRLDVELRLGRRLLIFQALPLKKGLRPFVIWTA